MSEICFVLWEWKIEKEFFYGYLVGKVFGMFRRSECNSW